MKQKDLKNCQIQNVISTIFQQEKLTPHSSKQSIPTKLNIFLHTTYKINDRDTSS